MAADSWWLKSTNQPAATVVWMNGIRKAGATEYGREWQVHTTTHRPSFFPCIQNVNHKLFDLDATFWTPEFGQGAETHDRRPTPPINTSLSWHSRRAFQFPLALTSNEAF